MTTPIPPVTRHRLELFWKKVDKTPGQGPRGNCWLWIGAKNSDGYGNLGWRHEGQNRPLAAHRVAYWIEHGKQPDGFVMHACDVPSCVNPDHLLLGTHADNMRDRVQKGRGGGHLRRGQANGRHTKPERTCRGERWHQLHDKPEIRSNKLAARMKFLRENPDKILCGEQNPRAKLTVADVRTIRSLRADGLSLSKIGKVFGISKTQVSFIEKRRSWAHVE
jgi:hypothetical protein